MPHDLIVMLRLGGPSAVPLLSVSDRPAERVAAIRGVLTDILPAGARIAGVSPLAGAARVTVATAAAREAIAEELRRDSRVLGVHPNRYIALDDPHFVPINASGAVAAVPSPNNPLYAWQAWHYGLIDMPRAWALSTGSPAVLVAVVDAGIRFDHPSIKDNLTSDGYDFVSDTDILPVCDGSTITNAADGDGYDPDPTIPSEYDVTSQNCFTSMPFGGHGLHVAGIIGAVGNSGVGMTGVNWRVRIRPVRVLGVAGFGTAWDIAQGILYAAGLPADDGQGGHVQAPTGARVINLSLGSSQDDPILKGAVVAAAGTGALVVAAAGNDASSSPFYPAAYPEVIAVAAVRPDGNPAAYSNHGSHVDIRAPGGDFNQGGASGGVASLLWDFQNGMPHYAFGTGTSAAAPHVSGAAALLLSRSPSLTAAELSQRLVTLSVGGATLYGAGLLNVYNSLAQRVGPVRRLFVRLQAPGMADGETVEVAEDGSFTFENARNGAYLVYGGVDEDGDGQIGIPGRWWGAYGGVTTPLHQFVAGRVESPITFTVGIPTVTNPFHSVSTPNTLAPGGYLQAVLVNTNQLDVYRFTVSRQGKVGFVTSGWVGACGFALEQATAVGVFTVTGGFIAEAEFISASGHNYCSNLELTLDPGTYLVAVAGAFPNGRYRIEMQMR